MIKSYLLAPGPTPVPPEVLAAMSLPIVHHRTPQFGAVLVGAFDVITGLAAIELALRHFGATVELGRGVSAAEAVLADGLPAR